MTQSSLTIIFLLLTISCYGQYQQQKSDSLWVVVNNNEDNLEAVEDALIELSWIQSFNNNEDSASIIINNLIDTTLNKGSAKAQSVFYRTLATKRGVKRNHIEGLLQKSIQLAEESQFDKGLSFAYYSLAEYYSRINKSALAVEYCEKSLDLIEGNKFPEVAGFNLNMIGRILRSQGKCDEAKIMFNKALQITSKAQYPYGMVKSMNALSDIYRDEGNFPAALESNENAAKLAKENKLTRTLWGTIKHIGDIYKLQDDYENALKYYKEYYHLAKEANHKWATTSALYNVGYTLNKMKNYDEALEVAKECLEVAEEMNSKLKISFAYYLFGEIYKDIGDSRLSVSYYNKSLDLENELGNVDGAAFDHLGIGQVYLKSEKYNRAINSCLKAQKMFNEIEFVLDELEACDCLYQSYKSIGQSSDALQFLERRISLSASLKSEETTKKLQQQEFSKKLLQDSLEQVALNHSIELQHQKELHKKNQSRNAFLAIGLIALLVAIGLWSRLKLTMNSKKIIEEEKQRSDNLLLNILPAEVAEELKQHGKAAAKKFDNVAVFFTDFKGFSSFSEKVNPNELVDELNVCFMAFDDIVNKYGLEKIKTIGDAYMAAAGVPAPSTDAIKNIVLAACEMQDFITKRFQEKQSISETGFTMRAGIHTGPVVAGIVGSRKFQYDLWGDTVNTAARMESTCIPGKVNISNTTYQHIKEEPQFHFENRGLVEAKGKGQMQMYFVKTA